MAFLHQPAHVPPSPFHPYPYHSSLPSRCTDPPPHNHLAIHRSNPLSSISPHTIQALKLATFVPTAWKALTLSRVSFPPLAVFVSIYSIPGWLLKPYLPILESRYQVRPPPSSTTPAANHMAWVLPGPGRRSPPPPSLYPTPATCTQAGGYLSRAPSATGRNVGNTYSQATTCGFLSCVCLSLGACFSDHNGAFYMPGLGIFGGFSLPEIAAPGKRLGRGLRVGDTT